MTSGYIRRCDIQSRIDLTIDHVAEYFLSKVKSSRTRLENGTTLAAWLNCANEISPPAYRRIHNLINQAQRLKTLLRAQSLHAITDKNTLDLSAGKSQIALLRKAINAKLAGYKYVPSLSFETNNMFVNWSSAKTATGKETSFMEADIVNIVCDLFNADQLAGLRQCDICKMWLMQVKPDMRFCSSKCRWTFASRTEDGRKYHNQKAKEQYERKRKPTLDQIRKVLDVLKENPLKPGHDWKTEVMEQVPEVSRIFLTVAVKKRDISPPG